MDKIKDKAKLILFILAAVVYNAAAAYGSGMEKEPEHISKYQVEVRNSWFYVNGEKFFVKGVNYCTWRPGKSPGEPNSVD